MKECFEEGLCEREGRECVKERGWGVCDGECVYKREGIVVYTRIGR